MNCLKCGDETSWAFMSQSHPGVCIDCVMMDDMHRHIPLDLNKREWTEPDTDKQVTSALQSLKSKGFTLVEILVTLAIIGILATVSFSMLNTSAETRLIRCNEDLQAYVTMTEQLREQTGGRAPRPDEMYGWMDTTGYVRDPAFNYIVNNVDANKGHGNDLDMCDEENPGKSTANRDCIDIKYVWICNHDHKDLAKYCFADVSFGPIVIPIHPITISNKKHPVKGSELTQIGNGDEFLRDLEYWTIEDPGLQKWIGR